MQIIISLISIPLEAETLADSMTETDDLPGLLYACSIFCHLWLTWFSLERILSSSIAFPITAMD
jgi:hypothetical protein